MARLVQNFSLIPFQDVNEHAFPSEYIFLPKIVFTVVTKLSYKLMHNLLLLSNPDFFLNLKPVLLHKLHGRKHFYNVIYHGSRFHVSSTARESYISGS